MLQTIRERDDLKGILLVGPIMFWLGLFLLVPLALMVVISFADRGTYGEVVYRFSLDNYRALAAPEYARILWRSIGVASVTTAACLLGGFPLAYFVALSPPGRRWLYLFLILVPFWTNFLIRIYAWMIILRGKGVLAAILGTFGLLPGWAEPWFARIQLYTPGAVLIGMVYEFLPFMVLPLYASIEKLDLSLLDAAADLGARPWRAFARVTLPLCLPGIVAGSVLVFVPAMGMFVVPDLMGGAQTVLIGNLVNNQFLRARDWPLGAAASMVMLVLTLGVTLLYTRVFGSAEDLAA